MHGWYSSLPCSTGSVVRMRQYTPCTGYAAASPALNDYSEAFHSFQGLHRSLPQGLYHSLPYGLYRSLPRVRTTWSMHVLLYSSTCVALQPCGFHTSKAKGVQMLLGRTCLDLHAVPALRSSMRGPHLKRKRCADVVRLHMPCTCSTCSTCLAFQIAGFTPQRPQVSRRC
jgi:hypothetical protein